MLKAHQTIAKTHGQLVLTNVLPHVREVFDLTGLFNKIIAIFCSRLPE